jgi:hypothetical protein
MQIADELCSMIKKIWARMFIATLILISSAAWSQFNEEMGPCGKALLGQLDVSSDILKRPIVARVRSQYAAALTLQPRVAQDFHLMEFEPLAHEMANQAKLLIPSKAIWMAEIDPYIQKLRTEKNLYYHDYVFGGLPTLTKYPADKIVDLLVQVRDKDIASEFTEAITTKTLTIDKMLDLSLRWAMAMTVAESIRNQQPLSLNEREALRLWQFLEGQRDIFVALFPLAYFRFHMAPMSIESILAISPKPVFPLQVATSTIHHVLENLDMRPIETLIHDIYHAIQRMKQSFVWLFPGNSPHPYFPPFSGKPEKQLIITPEWIQSVTKAGFQQERFHDYIFTAYQRYSKDVRASMELIWFQIYIAEQQDAKDRSMSAAGLKAMLAFSRELAVIRDHKLRDLAQLAQSGGLGARYLAVNKTTLRSGVAALKKLAAEYETKQ